jgi:chemotaxis protein methyltransferase CheR
MFRVTIDETNNIIRIISQKYGIDLSGLAMVSLRLKISQFCIDHHSISSGNNLIKCLQKEPGFLESFMQGIFASSPDMFRDPELWISLRNQILPQMIQDFGTFRILFPDIVSGEEIFSMAILLIESGLEKQIELTATCKSESIRELIENRPLARGRYKNCQDNFEVFNPGSSLDKYFVHRDGKYFLKSGMLQPVRILVQPEAHECTAIDAKLILCRNQMIYLKPETSRRRISSIIDQADEGCLFILGIKESFKYLGLKNKAHVISSDLNIYSKAG